MQGTRKAYRAPRLTVHGDVAAITQKDPNLGGSGCGPSVKGCNGGDGVSKLGSGV